MTRQESELFGNKSLITVLSILAAGICAADEPPVVYEPNWESLAGYPVPEWFDDAKFGIFIHWGGYSEFGYRKGDRGYAEHVPKMIYADPEHYYPVLEKRYGACPPEFGYKDLLQQFKAEKFDPEAWARLFDNAGARYVVLTAEHHDGYALWDSNLTDWCATKVGPMRDLVGDLGKAVRKRGLKYAPSYHRERHTGFFALEKYAVHSEPRPDIAEEIRRMPAAESLYGPFDYSNEFIADYVARWQEIQRKYRPDFMWIDDIPIFYFAPDDPQVAKFRQACAEMIADYFNAAQRWGIPVYLNNKGGHQNWPVDLGCLEKDNLQMESTNVKWENPATLATSYGYLAAEEEKNLYQSSEKLVHLLCDVVSKNGNLLLNIGPRGDGIIPDGMQQRLLEIGQWLDVNGQAIYGTRPWKTWGEGVVPTRAKRDKLGRHTINSTGIRFTRSKDSETVYAIILAPSDEPILIESFRDEAVRSVELLGSQTKVLWQLESGGLRVTLPRERPSQGACALRVSL
jgi:alpha-L-fucosidase